MARIAVIGAAGYVGQELSRQLKASGHDVVGIARANGSFLLERLGITHETPQRAQAVGRVDTVVNLAYPKSPSGFDYPAGNREILSTIRALAGTEARIVHASSLAVFGYALEHPQNPAPLDMRRDYFYIESKLELERLLLRAFPGRDLQTVRLGNVWGPASPTWTAALADRLLFGDPVGVAGADGYSNTTDVGNAASYLAHLASRPGHRQAEFHHLAEFAETRWSFWLERIEAALPLDESALSIMQSAKQQPKVAFGTLVETGYCVPGTVLCDPKRRWKAIVRADGSLECEGSSGSIHGLGAKLQGAPSCNGWTFWQYQSAGGETLTLASARKRLPR